MASKEQASTNSLELAAQRYRESLGTKVDLGTKPKGPKHHSTPQEIVSKPNNIEEMKAMQHVNTNKKVARSPKVKAETITGINWDQLALEFPKAKPAFEALSKNIEATISQRVALRNITGLSNVGDAISKYAASRLIHNAIAVKAYFKDTTPAVVTTPKVATPPTSPDIESRMGSVEAVLSAILAKLS